LNAKAISTSLNVEHFF